MSKRGNWDRLRLRKQQQRHGSESVTGSTPPQKLLAELNPRPRRSKQSKAELRAEAERALRQWKARQS
jgi:hypothetical protein